MKKLFVSVLAIAGLVACNMEDTVLTLGPAPLEFGAAFVENSTRADKAIDPSTTTTGENAIKAFDVWGFIDEVDGVVFDGEDVTGSQGNFTYANTQYWVPGHNYYFAAIAPMNSNNWKLDTTKANKQGAGEISFTNIDGTEDLLYSAVGPIAAPEANATSAQKVTFAFNHMLSKVKFTFTNGFANDNAYIDVKEITMTVPKSGKINVAQNWWSTNQWVLTGAETTTLAFGDACAKTQAGGTQESDYERLTIPAGDTQEYVITFKVQLYFGNVAAFTEPLTLTSKVDGTALEIGKAYNFKATLDANNITGENGNDLLPIEFDVTEVKEWVPAGDVDVVGTIGGEVEDMTLVENTVAASTVAVKGTFNGGAHTLSVTEGTSEFYANSMLTFVNLKNDGATIENVILDGNNASWVNPNDGKSYGIRNINVTAAGTYNINGVQSINATYPLHVSTTAEVTLNITDSTLQGWTSYNSGTTVNFTNVEFTSTPAYGRLRPYGTTVCKNCNFAEGFIIDLKYLAAGETITFENCKVNGVALTAANLTDADASKVTIQ